MYIKRDNVRIKRIVLGLHDVIADFNSHTVTFYVHCLVTRIISFFLRINSTSNALYIN